MNRRLLSIGGGVALLGAILAGGMITAYAQDPGSGNTTAESHQAEKDAYLGRLAGKLGISVDALKDAIKATNLEVLDQKVADGTITQAEADEIRARIEAGEVWFGVGGKHGRGHGQHGAKASMGLTSEELATFLGIDVPTLNAGVRAGKSLATIAQEAGKSRNELKAFLTEQAREHLAQHVSEGRLTQEQADQKLADFSAQLDAMIDGTFPGGHAGMRDGGARFAPAGAPMGGQF